MRTVWGPLTLLGLMIGLSWALPLAAQPGTRPAPAGQAVATSRKPVPEDFQRLLDTYKANIQQIDEIEAKFKQSNDLLEKEKLNQQYQQIGKQLEAIGPQLAGAAEVAYAADPKKYEEAAQVLVQVADANLQMGAFADAQRQVDVLIRGGFPEPGVYNLAGVAALGMDDLASAEKYFLAAQQQKALVESCEIYLREIQLRKRDAQANNLPQVVFKTSKGDIVIELFEDEAPNTVANFINLVEKKFYNGLSFHRVLDGFMAQGGDPKGDGTGGPGYKIACECYGKTNRAHLRGSLSMAHAGKDTGGSQFFLTFRPTPHLDNRHTVFGRVVQGMNVVDQLQRINPEDPQKAQPDKIIEARVLRKRNHPYTPQVIADAAENTLPVPGKTQR